MSWLATITISNAIVATGLGLFAYIVGRSSRNAALGHVLWVLVLIKLVTPPVFDLPLAVLPEWAVAATTVGTNASESTAIDLPPAMPDGLGAKATEANGATFSSNAMLGQHSVAAATNSSTGVDLSLILLWLFRIWIVGVVCCGCYQIYTTCQMWKLMKMASPDSRIDRAMHRVAKAANVKNYPIARVVPWVGSPMLWGLGGTSVIVLPAQLFESLEGDAADTLMQHELAHFQRGDQWVRILQAVVSTLYWWHPIVWLASRQIEVYEEQCCDGWVVRQNPPNRRRYAEALLDTVDFILGCAGRRIARRRERAGPYPAAGAAIEKLSCVATSHPFLGEARSRLRRCFWFCRCSRDCRRPAILCPRCGLPILLSRR